MLTLLKSLVIPLLEYCCQLWNPWKTKDIQAIEAIQRTFTYKITEAQHLNYWERLHELKLNSIQRRRERYIIIYIPENTQDMEHSALFSIQQTKIQHNPFKKMQ